MPIFVHSGKAQSSSDHFNPSDSKVDVVSLAHGEVSLASGPPRPEATGAFGPALITSACLTTPPSGFNLSVPY